MADTLVESISGARGIVGESITPELALRYGTAFAGFLGGGRLVIGGDSRTSHDVFKSAVMAGAMAAGCECVDIGICPTPTVGMSVKHFNASGAVAITASHNPVEWNGLKLFNNKGEFLTPRQYAQFRKVLEKPSKPLEDWKGVGSMSVDEDAITRHIETVLKLDLLHLRKIKRRKFRVVVDCVNGAGSIAAPTLLSEMGCHVLAINSVPDGRFARKPEPLPKNLTQLKRRVKSEKADIGFALDPDADRLAIVSENGKAIGEEHTLALALSAVLAVRPGSVVVNVSTSKMCEEVATKFGCRLYRSKVGEANVVELMRKKLAVIGGEGNGGVIMPRTHYGRDSLVGMALVLEHLANRKSTVTDAINQYPNYILVKDKGKLTDDFGVKLEKLKRKLDDNRIDELDGIRIDYTDSWVQIRKSNTEPIYRIFAEARTARKAKELIAEIKSLLK